MDFLQMIQECSGGDVPFSLKELGHNMWQACAGDRCFESGEGSSPEIAVKLLWKALHPSKPSCPENCRQFGYAGQCEHV